jgi:hypothetical protein
MIEENRMHMLRVAGFGLLSVMTASVVQTQSPRPGPLPQFRGTYAISEEPRGTVRISDALGTSYAEWVIRFDEPLHEVRLMVGELRADGTFPVWRFEQDPAPRVEHQGTGRLSGQGFVVDFGSVDGEQGKFLRERWTLTPGGLQFDLEASGNGVGPRRVGGFMAIRQ